VTFVLSVGTDDGIYQVSDRRLTRFSDGSVIDDNANKAVFLDGRMTFAYTGNMEILGQPSDLWLLDCFANVDTRNLYLMCDRVRVRADDAFARMGATSNSNLRHAFVGICWDSIDGGPLAPLLVTISNALDDNGSWLPQAQPTFTMRVNRWGRVMRATATRGALLVAAAGVTLTDREKAGIWRTMRTTTRTAKTPLPVLQTMMGLVDYVEKNHAAVGPGLLAVYIPKSCAEARIAGGGAGIFTGGIPSGNEPMFFDSPADRRTVTRTGPRIAIDGMTVPLFTSRPLSPEEVAETISQNTPT
jgi:hypothetical protein